MSERPELHHCEPLYESEARQLRMNLDPERVPDLYEVIYKIREEIVWTGIRIPAERIEDYQKGLLANFKGDDIQVVPITFKNSHD